MMQLRFIKSMVRAHTKVVQGRSVYVPAHRRIDHGTLPRARMSHNPSMAKTPEELASRFGPEADRFHLRDHEDKPLLVRRFGRGKKHAFAVHAGDGTHVATLHVQTGPQGAQVTAGWTHDAHHGNGAHNALLRRLVSHHGTVTSPTSMHHDLHRSFNTMDDDHELSTERTEGGGGVRYRLQRKQATLFKGLRVRLSKAFADPFPGRTSTGPKLTLPELIRAIRLAVTQEQEAIATYSAQADASPDPDAARVLRGIADEERVHTGELIHLLKLLAGEGEHLREGETEAMGTLKVRIKKGIRAWKLPDPTEDEDPGEKIGSLAEFSGNGTVYVCAKLPPDARKAFGHVPHLADNLHMTLLHAEDAATTPKQRRAVVAGLRQIMGDWGPVSCKCTGLAKMDNGEQTLVALVTVDGGASLHDRLRNHVGMALMGDLETKFDFVPHVTLREDGREYPLDMADMRRFKWTIRKLYVSFGPEGSKQWEINLGTTRARHRSPAVEFSKALLPLLKGRVKGHWRQTPEGKTVWVSDYTDKRTKKPQQAHVGPQSSLFDERPAQPPKPAQLDLFGVPQAPAQPKPAPPPSTAGGPDLALTVQTAKPTPDAAQTRKQFRDTGEKIGGARKDIQAARKRFEDELTASALADLEQQDPDAAARSVKKTVLWPKPDINAWREEGRDPRWVALARVLWDTVSAKPKVDTPAGRAAYHTGIDILREAVDSSADYEDLKAKLNGLAQTYRNVVSHTSANSIRQRVGQPSVPPLDQYELAVGAAILSLGNTGDWLRNYKRVKSNGLKGWLYNLDEIWPHRSEENLWSGIHEIWTDWRKANRTSTHKPKPEDLWRPSAPSEYERLGNPEPIDVHDASVFIDLFGVRGVEFGNWMDDAAASVHVNRAAEALADLADGLGIDRKQVSVNGRLALAFGARGSGPFLAHYEPGKVVINLTKLGGAGSLAHEWAHFLDHMIGKLELGLPAGHATEMGMGPVMPNDPPVVAALRRVMNTIYTGKPDGTWQRSEFFEVSKKRGEYWRKPWELFARAFECYVVDALAEKGRGNNYLAYDKSLRSPKAPYPRDKEREALKEAFDGLIEAIRQTGTLKKALRVLG